MLPEVVATRYVVPLREGGSLPGLMEADDLGTYVVKFRGAGQGRGTLVAEVVSGQLARALGLPVPELVTVRRRPRPGRGRAGPGGAGPAARAAAGATSGIDYLPGAFDLDPVAFAVDAGFAGRVLWFDALVGNVDRSWRNPNLLHWHGGAVPDRPRRDADVPAQLGRPRTAGRPAVRRRATTCCSAARRTSPAPTRRWPRW